MQLQKSKEKIRHKKYLLTLQGGVEDRVWVVPGDHHVISLNAVARPLPTEVRLGKSEGWQRAKCQLPQFGRCDG